MKGNFRITTINQRPGVKRMNFSFGWFIVLLAIALGMLGLFLAATLEEQSYSDWGRAPGRVAETTLRATSRSFTHPFVVEYVVDGQNYQVADMAGSVVEPSVGDQYQVAYDPSNPAQSVVVSEEWPRLLWLAVGLIILTVAIIQFVSERRRLQAIEKLKKTGKKFDGALIGVTQVPGKANRGHRVVVSVYQDGKLRKCISDPLVGAAGLETIDYKKNLISIGVFIDPENPQIYYVDVDDIPYFSPKRGHDFVLSANSEATDSSKDLPKPSA